MPLFRELALLDDGELALGSKARIRTAYSLVPTILAVTEVDAGRSFAWTSTTLPGLGMTVDHVAEAEAGGTRATLRVDISGPVGLVAAPVAGRLSRLTFDRSLAALKGMLESELSPAMEFRRSPDASLRSE